MDQILISSKIPTNCGNENKHPTQWKECSESTVHHYIHYYHLCVSSHFLVQPNRNHLDLCQCVLCSGRARRVYCKDPTVLCVCLFACARACVCIQYMSAYIHIVVTAFGIIWPKKIKKEYLRNISICPVLNPSKVGTRLTIQFYKFVNRPVLPCIAWISFVVSHQA